MAVGLELELGSRVRVKVMTRAWVRVRFMAVSSSNTVQFLTILRIPHCADADSALRRCAMGMVVRLGVRVSG